MRSSSVVVQSNGRTAQVERDELARPVMPRDRRRQVMTPEDAIRRQLERVKEKILSQLSFDVQTESPSGSVRFPLPQALLHMYDVDLHANQGTGSSIIDITDDNGRFKHDIQTTVNTDYDSKYKQAKLIVFGHPSKLRAFAQQ